MCVCLECGGSRPAWRKTRATRSSSFRAQSPHGFTRFTGWSWEAKLTVRSQSGRQLGGSETVKVPGAPKLFLKISSSLAYFFCKEIKKKKKTPLLSVNNEKWVQF